MYRRDIGTSLDINTLIGGCHYCAQLLEADGSNAEWENYMISCDAHGYTLNINIPISFLSNVIEIY